MGVTSPSAKRPIIPSMNDEIPGTRTESTAVIHRRSSLKSQAGDALRSPYMRRSRTEPADDNKRITHPFNYLRLHHMSYIPDLGWRRKFWHEFCLKTPTSEQICGQRPDWLRPTLLT